MQNKVYIKDDIVNSEFIGDQTKTSVLMSAEAAAQLLDEQAARGKTMKAYLDMSALGKVPAEARAAGHEAMKTVRDAKTAVVGAPMVVRYIIQFIVKASGKSAQLKFFDDSKSAHTWLAEAD